MLVIGQMSMFVPIFLLLEIKESWVPCSEFWMGRCKIEDRAADVSENVVNNHFRDRWGQVTGVRDRDTIYLLFLRRFTRICLIDRFPNQGYTMNVGDGRGEGKFQLILNSTRGSYLVWVMERAWCHSWADQGCISDRKCRNSNSFSLDWS